MFQYFLPEYGRLGEINYLYKLEGVDDEWKYINRGLFSNYTLLSPGNYTFKVKAMNLSLIHIYIRKIITNTICCGYFYI